MQNMRFIGGTRHNTFTKVAPSSEATIKGLRYTRRRLVLVDGYGRYEEVFFALDSLSEEEASDVLASVLRGGGKMRVPDPDFRTRCNSLLG